MILLTSTVILSFSSCSRIPQAISISQIGGGQYVSVNPGVAKSRGLALEAFHKKAQKKQAQGSYSYRYDLSKNAHARSASTVGIPMGVGPVGTGLMVLRNLGGFAYEKPETFSISGNTFPQSPVSISKGSRVSLSLKVSTLPYGIIGTKKQSEIWADVKEALSALGYYLSQSSADRIEIEVLRASSEDKYSTIELRLNKARPSSVRKAFLILSKNRDDQEKQIQLALTTMIKG